MKRVIVALLVCCFIALPSEATTPWSSKPPLGSQINWSHPLSKGLVGCWLMNEGGGRKANNLMVVAPGTLANGAYFANGGIVFDGADDILTADNMGIVDNSKPIWITVVAKIMYTTNNNTFFANHKSGTVDAMTQLRVTDANLLEAKYRTASADYRIFRGDSVFSANVPYHVSIIEQYITQSVIPTPTMYVNGRKETVSAISGSTWQLEGWNKLNRIGHSYDAWAVGDWWAGSIYYVYVYNRALSPSEIQ